MRNIANTEQFEAWNGDSGQRWVATDHLAETVPGRAMLDTVPDERRLTALDAVRTALADHMGSQGVQLDAGILITTAHLSR